ncbi:hypothetical protein DUI87_22983 [Hirundo rustica rustica]|uniref:Rna-directed dna polymerase from mobile element jockey-like n=1 Tax=Hirundo rustica rustica TaxID=333673 RepID=A0A3M0JI59_HIRRU|nr:hypothetical protein DUI87_22983 [Hirundo rustica rustica]
MDLMASRLRRRKKGRLSLSRVKGGLLKGILARSSASDPCCPERAQIKALRQLINGRGSRGGDNGGIECTFSKFADDTKLSGVVDTPEGQDAIQRDLDKIKNWVHGDLRSFNKTKCWCCTWLGAIPCTAQAGDEQMESSPAQRDLGVLLGERLDMTQQCVLEPEWKNWQGLAAPLPPIEFGFLASVTEAIFNMLLLD